MKALQLRMRAIRFIGALLPMAMLGCSGGLSDVPPESMAREYMEKLVATHPTLAGAAKVDSFKKTNGLKQVENGVEQYILEFQMEISYPKGFMPECVDTSHYNSKCFNAQLKGVQPKKIGTREADQGKIIFEKAEKGWRVKGVI